MHKAKKIRYGAKGLVAKFRKKR